MQRQHRLGGAVLLVTLLAASALGAYFEWKPDDAYISFAYARNWARGDGLVFNPGERVEGYTCFLWVVLLALGEALGADVRVWSTVLGIACALAAALFAAALAAELSSPGARRAAVFAAPLVSFFPSVSWWAPAGMETALFAMLVTAAFWLHARRGAASRAAPLVLALAAMTRPEGALLAAVLCADAIVADRRRGARYALLFAALFAPYFAWRWWYYGMLLPNTFYAKVGGTPAQAARGAAYLLDFLVAGRGALLLAGAALILASPRRRQAAPVLAFTAAYLLYVVAVGGDVFYGHRFAVPVVPALAALLVAATGWWAEHRWPEHPGRAFAAAGVVVALLLVIGLPAQRQNRRVMQMSRSLLEMHFGPCAFIRAHTSPDDVVAAGAVGVLKYCTDRRVLDTLGLTDRHIAHHPMPAMGSGRAGHERFDYDYVLARWPKYIVTPTAGSPWGLNQEDLRPLWTHPLLARWYLPTGFGYRRRDAEGE